MEQKTAVTIILLFQGDKQYFLKLVTSFYSWKKQFYKIKQIFNQTKFYTFASTKIMEKSPQKLERISSFIIGNSDCDNIPNLCKHKIEICYAEKRAPEDNFKVPVRTMVTWLPKENFKNANTCGEYLPFPIEHDTLQKYKDICWEAFWVLCVKGVKQTITAETTCF